MVNITLRQQFVYKCLQYSTIYRRSLKLVLPLHFARLFFLIFYLFSTEATITEEEINHAEGLLYNKLPAALNAVWCAHFSTL